MDIYKRIRRCRKKLNVSIKKNGIDSEITKSVSREINRLIKEYYDNIEIVKFPLGSRMSAYYKKSYLALKQFTKKNGFPTVKIWNNYAKINNFFSNKSLEYINKLDWNYLQIKVEREINIERI